MDGHPIPDDAPKPHPRRNTKAIGFAAAALIFVLGVGGYFAWRAWDRSPSTVITRIAWDATKGDVEGVEASIDTSALVDSAVEDALEATASLRLVTEYLKAHPGATEAEIKQKTLTAVDEELREHIRSGTLPKRIPLGYGSLKQLVAAAMAQHSVESVQVDGEYARVWVKVPYKGRTLSVQVRMRRSGDTWKVDKIENLAEVLKQAGL